MKKIIAKFKSMDKSVKIKLIMSLILVIGLIVGVGFNSMQTNKINESIPYTSNLYSELINAKKSEKIKDTKILLDAKNELLDDKKKEITNGSMKMNTPLLLGTLQEGKYILHMIASPIEIDGSTYKLPKESIEFDVLENKSALSTKPYDASKINIDGSTTNNQIEDAVYIESKTNNIIYSQYGSTIVQIKLERIPVDKMSKEQLNGVIKRIEKEAPKEKELIKNLKQKEKKAESKPETASDISKPSESVGESNKPTPTPDTPIPDKPNPQNPEPDKPTKATAPKPSKSTKLEKPNKPSCTTINHPAEPAEGYWETIPAVTELVIQYTAADGTVFDNIDDMEWYSAQNGINYRDTSYERVIEPARDEWIETKPAKPAWSEEVCS